MPVTERINSKEKIRKISRTPPFFSHLPALTHGSPKRQLFNHDIGYRIDETQIEIDQKHLNYEETDGPSGRLGKTPL